MYDNENFFGNSDYSRDIEYHLHSYTHPQTLFDEGPHILTTVSYTHLTLPTMFEV